MLPVAAMLVTGCVPAGNANSCAGWKPILLTEASIAALSDADAADVLAHNEFGRARGCW